MLLLCSNVINEAAKIFNVVGARFYYWRHPFPFHPPLTSLHTLMIKNSFLFFTPSLSASSLHQWPMHRINNVPVWRRNPHTTAVRDTKTCRGHQSWRPGIFQTVLLCHKSVSKTRCSRFGYELWYTSGVIVRKTVSSVLKWLYFTMKTSRNILTI